MLLEDYTELNSYVDALIAQLDAPVEEETDMEGYFTWSMIEETLDSMGTPAKQPKNSGPIDDTQFSVSPDVNSLEALLCIADSAASVLRLGKTNDPTVAEMVADMMWDTSKKIELDVSLPISTKEQNLMVLWLQRYAEKLRTAPAAYDGMKAAQGLWNNIQYKVRQFYEILA